MLANLDLHQKYRTKPAQPYQQCSIIFVEATKNLKFRIVGIDV
jgi:hypothetical protein